MSQVRTHVIVFRRN